MGKSGQTLGILLIAAGLVLGVAISAWLLVGEDEGNLEGSGAILGLILLLSVIVLPLVGAGIFVLRKANLEAKHSVVLDRQRALLDAVLTQGQVSLSELALLQNTPRSLVEADVRSLIGLGLFSGYVDWKRGMLFSVDAVKLQGMNTCPNCGGSVSLAGKGLVKCEYCGAEIFV